VGQHGPDGEHSLVLWIKALHVSAMVTWFAGLFYLPRLLVYHAEALDTTGRERFKVMERRLYAMLNIGMTATVVFGLWVLSYEPALLGLGWMRLKLALVSVLVAYHFWCGRLVRDFRDDRNVHSARWYRYFNEAPSLLLLAIVILVIVRPSL
jgi:protoporphyrinogen IX oxidase